jgi:hypothetical protein
MSNEIAVPWPEAELSLAAFDELVKRVRSHGFVDVSLIDDLVGLPLSEADFRDAAVGAAEYLARISLPGREISSEEYYLVMQLALKLGISCGLFVDALSDGEKGEVEDHLVGALKPRGPWVREDLSSGQYAPLSSVWPFSALVERVLGGV